MREICLVERSRGAIEVKVFGDKVILDEGSSARPFRILVLTPVPDVENWHQLNFWPGIRETEANTSK